MFDKLVGYVKNNPDLTKKIAAGASALLGIGLAVVLVHEPVVDELADNSWEDASEELED